MELTAWDAAEVAATAVTYAATLGAAGGVMFLACNHPVIADSDRGRIRRLVAALLVLSLLAGAARVVVTAGSVSGEFAGMFDRVFLRMVLRTSEGPAIAVRTAGLLLAAFAVVADRRLSAPALIGAAMAATSFAWVGHAQAMTPRLLPVVLVGVHLLGVAFWLGALAPLLLIAGNRDLSRIAAAAARFGAAALFVVGMLVTAGLGLLWILVGELSGMWNSEYGREMTLKLGLVAGLLCFAAWNRLSLTPRLLAHDPGAARSLRRSIMCEILIGAVILLVTATLTTVMGPPALN